MQYAACLVKAADFYWASGEVEEVLPLLQQATDAFETALGRHSRPVAQLSSLICLAHMCLGDFGQAGVWNDRAAELVKSSFGDMSWEHHRVKIDKVNFLPLTSCLPCPNSPLLS